ncbi:MAG: DUF3501 family protein [Deltaproteobacteria bacterium]|nr:DUF3501 family protein [Deltaproteobacteria bacterium]
MRPIERGEILDLGAYEEVRDRHRKRIIALKRDRRIRVGDRVTIVFENRDTLVFQIQEMLRTERISSERGILGEIEVYSSLLPGPDELSATLFVEVTDPSRLAEDLHALVGIDEHVALVLGDRRLRARFEEGRQTADRLAAVQYIRLDVGADARALLADPAVPAALEIDHPRYRHRAELPAAMRASLLGDLSD